MRFDTRLGKSITLEAYDTQRGGGSSLVAEFVTFRLNNAEDGTEFISAANCLTPFLNATGAVKSRTLSVDDSGMWTDCIVWTSLKAAQDAADKVMQDPDAQPFMSMIDPETVTLRHAPIRFSMIPE